MTELELDDVQDVAGRAEKGRTVEILLEDGNVLVGRVRQVQGGDIDCPDPDCFRRFDSTKGAKTHVGKFHPELVTKECPECESLFHPTPRSQTYCSTDCHDDHRSNRVTKFCEECGRSFDVKASHADGRRHCCLECKNESNKIEKTCPTCREVFESWPSEERTYCSRECWIDRETEHSRVEKTCPHCDDTFELYPSEDKQYCSQECYSNSRWETKICPMCGDQFESHAKNKKLAKTYCSQECMYEGRRSDPRPDGPDSLIQELEEEDHDVETVVARAHAHLGPRWDLIEIHLWRALLETGHYEAAIDQVEEILDDPVREDLRDRLLERAAVNHGASSRIQGSDIYRAIEESETILEVSDTLRLGHTTTRSLLNRLGLGKEFQKKSRDLVEELRDQTQDEEWPGARP